MKFSLALVASVAALASAQHVKPPSGCVKDNQVAFSIDTVPNDRSDAIVAELTKVNQTIVFHTSNVQQMVTDRPTNDKFRVMFNGGHTLGLVVTENEFEGKSAEDIVDKLIADSEVIHDEFDVYPKFVRLPYRVEGVAKDVHDALEDAGFVVSGFSYDTGSYDHTTTLAAMTKTWDDLVASFGSFRKDGVIGVGYPTQSMLNSMEGLFAHMTAGDVYSFVSFEECLGVTGNYRSTNAKTNNKGGGSSDATTAAFSAFSLGALALSMLF